VAAPSGAAACELPLLRNIASRERFAKVYDPRLARNLYEAVRDRNLEAQTWQETRDALASTNTLSDPIPLLVRAQDPPTLESVPRTESPRQGEQPTAESGEWIHAISDHPPPRGLPRRGLEPAARSGADQGLEGEKGRRP